MKIVAKNKKAKFNYQLLDKYIAGISLRGWEVKSIKNGDVSMDESFVIIDRNGNLQLHNLTISKYKFDTLSLDNEKRNRQLLLNKTEIRKINKRKTLERLVIVPTIIFISKKGYIKVEIALAKPRKKQDRREYEKEKEFERDKKNYF